MDEWEAWTDFIKTSHVDLVLLERIMDLDFVHANR